MDRNAKPPGISALALLSAALVMVLVLAGGVEAGSGSGRNAATSAFDLSILSPIPEDAQIGSARTDLQISGRRDGGGVAAPAALAGSTHLTPALCAITLLLIAMGTNALPRLSRPSPRGPPAV